MLIAVTGVDLPAPVLEPFAMVGAAAVPAVLIGFGASLHGQRVLGAGSARRDVVVASVVKLVVMPLVAWGVGLALGLTDELLRAVVVLAALPVAQNVLVYAQRYDASVILARDTILVTTLGSVPVLILVSTLL